MNYVKRATSTHAVILSATFPLNGYLCVSFKTSSSILSSKSLLSKF